MQREDIMNNCKRCWSVKVVGYSKRVDIYGNPEKGYPWVACCYTCLIELAVTQPDTTIFSPNAQLLLIMGEPDAARP